MYLAIITIEIAISRNIRCFEIPVIRSSFVSKLIHSAQSRFPNSRISKDPGHSPVKQISQQFRKSIARTPDCCGLRVRRYSIFDIADSRSRGCRLGDLTDSRRVESKSSYSATRRREIEIFGKRFSTGSRYSSEIVGFFATISLVRTYPFSKYLDLATTILEIARYRFHSSRDSQIAKTTSYAARISNVENRVPRSALFATIWSFSDRLSKLLRDFFDERVDQMLRNPLISKRDCAKSNNFATKLLRNTKISKKLCCEILLFRF